jgi:hypothetical protein
MIKSHLLYQLSYAPGTARKAFARGRRLAKRPPDVQQSGGVFPAMSAQRKGEKAAGIQRLSLEVSIG